MEELHLLRDFGIITGVAGIAVLVMYLLRLPSILGYLIAGIIVGPYLFEHPLVEDLDTVRGFADLGLVLLLFSIGLEFGWQRIREVGIRVLVIGTIEMGVMIAVGYQLGLAFGWTSTEAVFLGAALSISSSAVLVKLLRDAGQLQSPRGRLIVGILVVEDFVAVILLSLLAGVATTGTASIGDIGAVAGKLGIFAAVALVGGAIVVPRFIRIVSATKSGELLLIVGIGLASGMALLGEQLGLSAAAGAFLIGAVLGDTEEAEEIEHRIGPVRDIFAALFFVSVGMLIDFGEFSSFIVPALIAASVFMLVKIIVPTVATFITGQNGKTSLSVGFGMPQLGEFSLAIVKVGAEHAAVSAILLPVVTLITGITAIVYPFIFNSADRASAIISARSPGWMKLYVRNLTVWFFAMRAAFSVDSENEKQLQRAIRGMVINLSIIVVVLVVASFLLANSTDLGERFTIQESLAALAVSAVAVALCIPSGLVLWREVNLVSRALPQALFERRGRPLDPRQARLIGTVLRHTFLALLLLVVFLVSVPFLVRLIAIGNWATPLPVILIVVFAAALARSFLKVHSTIESSFQSTFFGK